MLNNLLPVMSLLATVSVFFVPTASAPAAMADDPVLCFGQVPTIVGTPGESLIGTPGADVVMTDGAGSVKTRGGDDLVCVTGQSDLSTVESGPGDDRVDSSAANSGWLVLILPGPGADEVFGGPGIEDVRAHQATASDVDRDVITLGGGNDHVKTGGSSTNEDVRPPASQPMPRAG